MKTKKEKQKRKNSKFLFKYLTCKTTSVNALGHSAGTVFKKAASSNLKQKEKNKK
jgi:hypothetical protein